MAKVVLLLLDGPATNIAFILSVILLDISEICFSWLNSKQLNFDERFLVFGINEFIVANVPIYKLLALSKYNC